MESVKAQTLFPGFSPPVASREAQLLDALRTANAELHTLSYALAHDLSAPLRHITGFGELLLQTQDPALEVDTRESLHTIVKGARRMQEMLDILIEYSHVNSATMLFEEHSAPELLQEALDAVGPRPANYGLKVECDSPTRLYGDRALLRQLFTELVSNAFKFTQPVPDPQIEVRAATHPQYTFIQIRDNGVGYPAKYASQLFCPFKRLHTQEQFPGRGIGLAKARRIASRHGGRIWSESGSQGATFFVHLPIIRVPQVLEGSERALT